eukprot:GILI01002547.1.p1 GENE.GILI01002547.1~~GILI01002547.1.p1  ORF type:complete len:530 (-),score=95.99 GILI01002547.1:765-2123(-)
MVALLLSAPCASEWDRGSMLVLRYFLSPFIDLGSVAVIALHVGISVGIMACHLAVVYFVWRKTPRSDDTSSSGWRSACADCFFPAIPMIIMAVLYMGVAVASMEAFYSKDQAGVAVASIIGIPFLLLAPGLTLAVILKSNASFVPTITPVDNNIFSRLVMPTGHWSPATGNRLVLGAHGWVKSPSMRFVALAVPYGAAVLLAVIVSVVSDCQIRYGLVSAITGAACIGIAAIRPHRSVIASILTSVAFGSLSFLSGAQLAAISNGESSGVVQALRLLAMAALLIAALLRSIHAIVILWLNRSQLSTAVAPVEEGEPDTFEAMAVKEDIQVMEHISSNSAAVSRAPSMQPSHKKVYEKDVIQLDDNVTVVPTPYDDFEELAIEQTQPPVAVDTEVTANFSDDSSEKRVEAADAHDTVNETSDSDVTKDAVATMNLPTRSALYLDVDGDEENHY